MARVPLAVGPENHDVLVRTRRFQKSPRCPAFLGGVLEGGEILGLELMWSPFTAHVVLQGPGLTSLPPPGAPFLPLQPPWFQLWVATGC